MALSFVNAIVGLGFGFPKILGKFVSHQVTTYLHTIVLGCAILPKVLGLISDVDFPIPLPMNSSPSEKKSNLFHFQGPANHFEVYSL